MQNWLIICASGFLAGTVNGILGTGGGMILIPLLMKYKISDARQAFATSLAVMLPVCACSLAVKWSSLSFPFLDSMPYLAGGLMGGVLGGKWQSRISTDTLHMIFGIMILFGGFCLLWK